MPELIAQNEQEYVASAINLAHNPERLADIRHNLRERMGNSPLVNGKLFAANLEGLYSLIRA
jgi:predicted O-linked N-acetylglucosamine transferase (SPINDLY family)